MPVSSNTTFIVLLLKTIKKQATTNSGYDLLFNNINHPKS